jgi:hypothetical protein
MFLSPKSDGERYASLIQRSHGPAIARSLRRPMGAVLLA